MTHREIFKGLFFASLFTTLAVGCGKKDHGNGDDGGAAGVGTGGTATGGTATGGRTGGTTSTGGRTGGSGGTATGGTRTGGTSSGGNAGSEESGGGGAGPETGGTSTGGTSTGGVVNGGVAGEGPATGGTTTGGTATGGTVGGGGGELPMTGGSAGSEPTGGTGGVVVTGGTAGESSGGTGGIVLTGGTAGAAGEGGAGGEAAITSGAGGEDAGGGAGGEDAGGAGGSTITITSIEDATISLYVTETLGESAVLGADGEDRDYPDPGTGEYGVTAFLLRPAADALDAVQTSATLVSAELVVTLRDFGNALEIVKVTEQWSEADVTWATAPSVETDIIATIPASTIGEEDSEIRVDLTDLVAEWRANPATAYGIKVQMSSPGTNGVEYSSSEDSSGMPRFEIVIE
ncbi:MAG: DNRLRE domain-containing protein [Polyangiaceae bacterium]|nr:DNRLRE domain-containing protein [Polyangiaceae bacterium]